MKNLAAFLAVIIGISFLTAWLPAPQQEKVYELKFTEGEIRVLYNVVDKSDAAHLQVEAVKKLITEQYTAQQDTVKTKKPK